MSAAETLADRRQRLAKVQSLYIRLLFCDRTLAAYTADPVSVLDRFGLPPEFRRVLPEPEDPRFKAEAAGRKTGVYRSIALALTRTLEVLERIAGREGVSDLSFRAFLSSAHFFDPDHGLPDPTGVGPGYEPVSKFYFWVRDAYGTARAGADPELRMVMNYEFATHLFGLLRNPVDPYFHRFKGGLWWRSVPGVSLPVFLLTQTGGRFTIQDATKLAEIQRAGLLDLDGVTPEPFARAPNIL